MLPSQKPDQFVIANAEGGSNLVDLHIGDRHAIARDDVAFYFKIIMLPSQKPDQFVIANAEGGSILVDLHIGDRHAIARDDVAFYFKIIMLHSQKPSQFVIANAEGGSSREKTESNIRSIFYVISGRVLLLYFHQIIPAV